MKVLKNIFFLLCFSFYLFVLNGCDSKKTIPNVDHLVQPIKIENLDQALFSYNGFNYDSLNLALNGQFPDFYADYVQSVLGIGTIENPMIDISLLRFVENENWRAVQQDIDKQFADLKTLEKELSQALAYYKYYFPTEDLPKFLAYNSGFNYANHLAGDYIGVGLEFYLGAENETVQLLATDEFPNYLKEKMDVKFLLPNTLEFMLLYAHFEAPNTDDFLHNIVALGKMKYLLSLILPGSTDDVIMLYSPEQLAWVEQSEAKIWEKFVKDELIYSTDSQKIMKMIIDGPFTIGLPKESPGRVAVWLGYKMVKDYMKKYPETKLIDLLAEPDAKKIMSAYKPKK